MTTCAGVALVGFVWNSTLSDKSLLQVRFGYNRISQTIDINNKVDPASLGLNTNTTSWNGLLVRNNSAVVAMRHPDCSRGCTNVRYSGNISPLPGYYPAACVAGVVYRDNVWTGGTNRCDSTDITVSSPGFVDAGSGNLHLTASSPAINRGDPTSFPATDIDGNVRPMGPAPDAGADEAG